MEEFMKKNIWRQAVRTSGGIGLVLGIVGLVAGCASSGEESKPPFSPLPPGLDAPATNGGTGTNASAFSALSRYGGHFTINDQVTVKFSGTIDPLPIHEERIKDDGTITLPLIGAVKAEGKTPGELQKEIHDRYVPEYYKRLTPTVTGEQRVYSVGGQVKAPGRQVYIGTTTVTKAIQSAGDFTDFAAKTRVELTRADGKMIKVDCEKAAKDPSLDLPIYPGDKINVPQRDIRDIFR